MLSNERVFAARRAVGSGLGSGPVRRYVKAHMQTAGGHGCSGLVDLAI
jgi:hypothetical protein